MLMQIVMTGMTLLIIPLWYIIQQITQPQNLVVITSTRSGDEIAHYGRSLHRSQYGRRGFHVRKSHRVSYSCTCRKVMESIRGGSGA
jgi:hypothetical protein